MKKMIAVLAVCAGVLAFAPATRAQELKPYSGVGIGAFGLEYKDSTVSQKNTVFGGFAKLGVDVNPYFGAELRIGTTGSGTKTYTGTTTSRKLSDSYFLSYLAKLQYPVDTGFNIYAMVGGTTAKFKLATNLTSVSQTKTGFSYGAGFDYTIQDQWTGGVEWMQYWTNVKLGSTFGTNAKAKLWGAVASVAYHY